MPRRVALGLKRDKLLFRLGAPQRLSKDSRRTAVQNNYGVRPMFLRFVSEGKPLSGSVT